MRADHGRVLLNRADVVIIFQQMGRGGMPKYLTPDLLGNLPPTIRDRR